MHVMTMKYNCSGWPYSDYEDVICVKVITETSGTLGGPKEAHYSDIHSYRAIQRLRTGIHLLYSCKFV